MELEKRAVGRQIGRVRVLSSLEDVDGQTTSYTYTKENEVESIQQPGVTGTIGFEYDANGNRTQIGYPGGTYVCTDYDDAGRITSVVSQVGAACGSSATVVTSFGYAYAASGGSDTGVRVSRTAQYPGGSASTLYFCYDAVGRLSSAGASVPSSCPDGSAANRYSYDASGNMTSMTELGSTSSFSFNSANEVSTSGYSYDGNGSQTAVPGVFSSASYNKPGQMSSVTPSGGSAASMSYTGLGQSLRVSAGSTSIVNDRLGLEQTSSAANGTTSFTRTPEGTIVGETTGGSNYYFLFDGLGSVVAVVDGSGSATPVTTYTYTPYGKPSCTSGTCSLYEPIRFAGGYQDSQDGNERLVKFGERYYDFSSGRWTQLDPVNQPLDLHGWNGYIYAGDDPVNNVDPSGMSVASWLKGVNGRVEGWLNRIYIDDPWARYLWKAGSAINCVSAARSYWALRNRSYARRLTSQSWKLVGPAAWMVASCYLARP